MFCPCETYQHSLFQMCVAAACFLSNYFPSSACAGEEKKEKTVWLRLHPAHGIISSVKVQSLYSIIPLVLTMLFRAAVMGPACTMNVRRLKPGGAEFFLCIEEPRLSDDKVSERRRSSQQVGRCGGPPK